MECLSRNRKTHILDLHDLGDDDVGDDDDDDDDDVDNGDDDEWGWTGLPRFCFKPSRSTNPQYL